MRFQGLDDKESIEVDGPGSCLVSRTLGSLTPFVQTSDRYSSLWNLPGDTTSLTQGSRQLFQGSDGQTITGLMASSLFFFCLFFFLTGLHFFHLLLGVILQSLLFWSCSFSFSFSLCCWLKPLMVILLKA